VSLDAEVLTPEPDPVPAGHGRAPSDPQPLAQLNDPAPRVARDTICIVLNAGSGKKAPELAQKRIRAALEAEGLTAEILLVRHGRELQPTARRALEAGHGTIVAAGGDGTIAGVAEVVAGRPVRFGVIPLGTFNYFARSYEIPTEIEAAVAILGRGAERRIRAAYVNGRLFLNNASLGAYPAILRQREDTYARWGRSRVAAYWSVLQVLARLKHAMVMELETDGAPHRLKSPVLFVANNPYQLEELGLDGAAEIRDGRLAVFAMHHKSRAALIWAAARLGLGLAEKGSDFELVSGREVTVSVRESARMVARDGEIARLEAPFRFEMVEDALTLCVPEPGQAEESGAG